MKFNDNMTKISVIVPVLHEEDGINALLRHVRDIAADEPIEIILIDGDPDGRTIKKIRSRDALTLRSPKGRGTQMNVGAASAQGNILLFLHADTILPENAFGLIREAIEDERYCGGAFDLGIESTRFLLRLTALCASLKHRITRVPYGDQAIFIRTDFFREIGGYSEIPLFEDVELMRRIKKLKKKIIILRSYTKTSPRKWEKDGILYKILRNWTLQTLYLMGASPKFLVKHYYGGRN